MTVYKDVAFERVLLDSGWWPGQSDGYDRELGLDTDQMFTFIGATQQDRFDQLVQFEGDNQDVAQQKFAKHVAREIDARGALDVLRHGVKDRGVLGAGRGPRRGRSVHPGRRAARRLPP